MENDISNIQSNVLICIINAFKLSIKSLKSGQYCVSKSLFKFFFDEFHIIQFIVPFVVFCIVISTYTFVDYSYFESYISTYNYSTSILIISKSSLLRVSSCFLNIDVSYCFIYGCDTNLVFFKC